MKGEVRNSEIVFIFTFNKIIPPHDPPPSPKSFHFVPSPNEKKSSSFYQFFFIKKTPKNWGLGSEEKRGNRPQTGNWVRKIMAIGKKVRFHMSVWRTTEMPYRTDSGHTSCFFEMHHHSPFSHYPFALPSFFSQVRKKINPKKRGGGGFSGTTPKICRLKISEHNTTTPFKGGGFG